jgi:hypothetical protein
MKKICPSQEKIKFVNKIIPFILYTYKKNIIKMYKIAD